jgi:beta-lactam-binding protein with PASTA domain/tRNA A-37 threonylcarbamoyl transferase component Bud32
MINTPDRQNNRKIVAMDDTLADPLAGRLLDGRYAVTARIAHGGMATVYRATDTRLDREVALKVMHAELARDEEFVRRFIGEAKSVARLSHQNVVAVYDQGADGPFLYLTMEYVPGRTLKQLLRDSGRFSPATALEIMAGVLDGLAAAHASGIVHRDVKPENVLVTADGRVKVADFGLARALSVAGHTRAGLLIGTVAYVPPEQVTGGTTGPRGDVYSAGVMLSELLTGRLPFTGDTPLSIAYQHVNADVPAPSALASGIDPQVDQLVLAATSRDPAGRPADAGEFLRAVRGVAGGPGGYGGAGSPPMSRGGLGGIFPPGEQSVMGAGVQGLGEAPWLDLDTPPATNGWWARGATQPPVNQPNGSEPEDSHTLVVDREDAGGGRHQVGREPFLGRWLFSPRLLIVVLVVALCAGLGLGGWWLFAGRYAHVPAVAEDSVSQATAILTADGFTVRHGGQVHSNTVPKGKVVSTSPAGRVSKGATITLLISSGPFTSVVPHVENDTQSAAQAALARVHLVSTIQKVGSSAPVGTVVGTNPPAGTTWPQIKTVTILVAAGPPLPDFTGQSIDAARQWAQQNNVKLQEESDSGSQDPAGTVTSQQPAGGATFQPGETVVVHVSTGPQLVPVPAVIGMNVLQATQVLRQAGFQVKVNKFGFTNKVWDYSPVGEAPAGSTITLEVGPF